MSDLDSTVIVFSLDVDWVSDEVLEWALGLFRERGLPVTVFATDKTPVLEEISGDVEVGIHPRFTPSVDHEQHIRELKEQFPASKGVRSHGLFEYSDLMNKYVKCGLSWDSSQLMYLCHNIRPYRHPSGLIRLPIFLEDDDYFSSDPQWEIGGLALEKPGVKCFDFHPIHLRLNTFCADQYSKARGGEFSEKAILDAEYKGDDKGTFAFFRKLCDYIGKNGLETATIGEVCSWV